MATDNMPRSQRYMALARAFQPPGGQAAPELASAYTRLFLGPGQFPVHPYESAHLEGRLMGEAAERVARCYSEAGLRVRDTFGELPDHISLELGFMSYLATQEGRDPVRAEIWRERQRRFLCEHLARWVPRFCEQILASEAHPFYREAALSVNRLLEEEMARLATHRAGEGQAYARPPHVQACEPDGPGRSRRYPNIRLSVDPRLCTLCTLCSDNCRPGALSVDCTPASLSLVLDPARCNGCRACVRLCPERAITIERGSPLAAPRATSRLVLASAPRVLCPDCHRPHIAAPWLERLADRLGGGEPARLSLALCPSCKTASGVGPAVLAGLPQEPAPSV